MPTKLIMTLGDPDDGGVIAEGEITSLDVRGGEAASNRPINPDEIVITYMEANLQLELSRHQQNGTPFKKVAVRSIETTSSNGSARTLRTWEFDVVYVSATESGSHKGEPSLTATLVFQSFLVEGSVVGLEDELLEDADPRLFAGHQVVELTRPKLPNNDDDATAVLCVCRNEWNTVNSHPTGIHWFSA